MTPDLSRRLGEALGTHTVSLDERAQIIAGAAQADDWSDLSSELRQLIETIEHRPLALSKVDKPSGTRFGFFARVARTREQISDFNSGQKRDDHGRWTSGGGGGDEDTAGAAAIAAAVDKVQADLAEGKDVEVPAALMPALMDAMKGAPSVNLEHVQVTGKGNENCFAKHATETPRDQMPQLPETFEALSGVRDRLEGMGVKVELLQMDPRELHATQNELDSKKVGTLSGYVREGGWRKESILIASRENAVVDGHHRWAAGAVAVMSGMDFKVNVMKCDMPIKDLLVIAEEFSGAHKSMGQQGEVAAA